MVYKVNDRVLCRHGAFFYDAKIVDTKQDGELKYQVHYKGWHKRYDEWIASSDSDHYFKKFTEEAFAAAKAEVAEATAARGKRKTKSKENEDTVTRPSGSKTSSHSRGTTPSDRAPTDLDTSVSLSTSVIKTPVASLKKEYILPHNKDRTPQPAKNTPTGGGRKRKGMGPDETPSSQQKQPTQIQRDHPEGKLNLPLPLREILVDDQATVCEKHMLFKLPCTYTVDAIVNDYLASLEAPGDDMFIEYDKSYSKYSILLLRESAYGVCDYFNEMLPRQLLFKLEAPQFSRISELKPNSADRKSRETGAKKRLRSSTLVKSKEESSESKEQNEKQPPRPSAVYGFPHLLRLLSRLDGYLRLYFSEDALKFHLANIADFIVFLNKNRHHYFDLAKDYEKPSAEYIKSALS